MNYLHSKTLLFSVTTLLLVTVGLFQSWNVALTILNLCLISVVMALGVNIQWGYAGLVNFGAMGFAALGGLAVVLIAAAPVGEAWRTGGTAIILCIAVTVAAASAHIVLPRVFKLGPASKRALALILVGTVVVSWISLMGPAIREIEAVDPSLSGYLGGLGLPVLLAWIAGPMLAAGAGWLIGKVALGLRVDYLAIATLGISEIVVTLLKNEDWLTRGVKNVVGLPRPVPFEIDLQRAEWFQHFAETVGQPVDSLSSIFVKLCFAGLFVLVLVLLMWLTESALHSPWGRMIRAVRDNEVAASAMGKDIKKIHLRIFVLGSAVIGLAGAMLVTLDGQFTPGAYQPLRFTFLVWIMVILGGSGNNWGSVLGGFIVWFFWVEAEPLGAWLIDVLTLGIGEESALRQHLVHNAAQMRLVVMGLLLLVVMRFMPLGLLPERRE
ncbi:branched-chain amino acid transport system permease protein [Labrenzia sp. EL_132]|nr:branched-chain amino acid transport system permease protein [Labrenzia sp. EL_132]